MNELRRWFERPARRDVGGHWFSLGARRAILLMRAERRRYAKSGLP
jgi:hypothetical protein